MQETANILVRDFAGALEAQLAPAAETLPPTAELPQAREIGAGSVSLRALWAWLKRMLQGLLSGSDHGRRG
jgi:hypothetical protein